MAAGRSIELVYGAQDAGNMIANGLPGTAVLRGDQLTMDAGSGGGGLTVTIRVNSQNSVTWVYPSGVADRLRRC